jgi:adenine-specific DNA-methyltransferase
MITIKEAEEILKKEYHRDNFLYLLTNDFLPDYKKDERDVSFNNIIFTSVVQLGISKKCDVVIFEVSLNENVQNRRVAITQEMFRILRGQRINNALVAFYNTDRMNYRISLLTSKYEFDGDKIRKVISNPRRYSYYLGYGTKTNTTYKYLIQQGKVNSIDELIKRFSVKVVNDDFYNEIAIRFTELVGGERKYKKYKRQLKIYGVTDQNKYSEFTVRLIGRIVFCWFLKEKKSNKNIPLIPDNLLSIQAIKENENYYHTILEPLFYEILNTEQKKRKNKFGREDIYKKIPYLNGGLFNQHNDDHYEYSTATESGTFGIVTVPDKWFIDLFSVFEQYNFTVDENTTYDVELSIDPEMLGRIFENLLAEINPETKETLKKDTGSYYTPRDIVEYMVDSSLCDYLFNKTNIESKKLNALLKYNKDDETYNFTDNEKENIIDALYSLTIIDPACGSGAFPIGMLQKVVYILQEIDENAKLWFDKAIGDSLLRREFEKKFSVGALDFIRKLGVIKNSIFGLDIQPIAAEIARLRCFLSLIIEEKIDDNEDNRGINPLPNLDFKFVIVDTLVGLDNDPNIELFEDQSHINSLKKICDEYFNADYSIREELKKKFEKIQKEMLETVINHYKEMTETMINNHKDENSSRYLSLLSWKPFEYNVTEWFDPNWMFGIKNGFDIVIGNPPYVRQERLGHNYKIILKKQFPEIANGIADLYVYFYGAGLRLLKEKGILIYITLNKYLKTKYGLELRNYLAKYFDVDTIIDFFELPVFEASTDTSITKIYKSNKAIETKYFPIKTLENLDLEEITNGDFQKVLKDESEWKFIDIPFENILKKFHDNSIPLKEFVNDKIFYGIKTGYNEAFVLDNDVAKQLLKSESRELVKPYAKSTDIEVYKIKNENYFLATGYNLDIRGIYPSAYKYLQKFETKLKLRQDKGENWWNLRACAYYHEICKPKIIYIHTAVNHQFFFDTEGRYINNSCYMIISDNKYLFAFLNSKLFKWFKKIKFVAYGDAAEKGRAKLDYNKMITVPIKNASLEQQMQIIDIVNQIFSIKKSNPSADVSDLENDINHLFYKLYDFTREEISIIESNL